MLVGSDDQAHDSLRTESAPTSRTLLHLQVNSVCGRVCPKLCTWSPQHCDMRRANLNTRRSWEQPYLQLWGRHWGGNYRSEGLVDRPAPTAPKGVLT